MIAAMACGRLCTPACLCASAACLERFLYGAIVAAVQRPLPLLAAAVFRRMATSVANYAQTLEAKPARSRRRSSCRIPLQQGLRANEGVVQRGQDHFAISHRTCMFCQSATRSIAVLRPLQSTASVIVASASAASLRSVRRLQRCAQWAPQQVGGDLQALQPPVGVRGSERTDAIDETPPRR